MNLSIGDTIIAMSTVGHKEIVIVVNDIRLVDDLVIVYINRTIDDKIDELSVVLENLTAWLNERQWRKV